MLEISRSCDCDKVIDNGNAPARNELYELGQHESEVARVAVRNVRQRHNDLQWHVSQGTQSIGSTGDKATHAKAEKQDDATHDSVTTGQVSPEPTSRASPQENRP